MSSNSSNNATPVAGDDYTRTRAAVATVENAAAKSALSGGAHDADMPAEEDPIERITRSVPIVVPAAGALMIFMLAFIAIYMA